MADVKVNITDSVGIFRKSLSERAEKALTYAGEALRGYAVYNAPVRTGDLRRSFTVEQHDKEVNVGVPLGELEGDYAKYVEFGTSKQSAQYPLTRAAEEHVDEYVKIIEREIKK